MRKLRNRLAYLKDNHRLVGIKGGTEVEANSFEEIYLMRRVSQGIVPMTVKIGGPEARNDIEFMLAVGIDKILAPMVESPYALKNFVQTMDALDPAKLAKLAVNIETFMAYENLERIYGSPWFERIEQVTVGRSDLSGSMEKGVDDPEVLLVTRQIIQQAIAFGKMTSVGGQVNTSNAVLVRDTIGPACINTRHMTVSCDGDVAADIAESLTWEKELYSYLETHFPERQAFYRGRVRSIEERIAQREKELAGNRRLAVAAL